jgi:hypothetical protein
MPVARTPQNGRWPRKPSIPPGPSCEAGDPSFHLPSARWKATLLTSSSRCAPTGSPRGRRAVLDPGPTRRGARDAPLVGARVPIGRETDAAPDVAASLDADHGWSGNHKFARATGVSTFRGPPSPVTPPSACTCPLPLQPERPWARANRGRHAPSSLDLYPHLRRVTQAPCIGAFSHPCCQREIAGKRIFRHRTSPGPNRRDEDGHARRVRRADGAGSPSSEGGSIEEVRP